MRDRAPTTAATIIALTLLTIIAPEPIILDILGVGLASLGLTIICDRGASFYPT